MSRRDLKVVGNRLSRCNNSNPRHARENLYAIFARAKIPCVFKSQDKHNTSSYSIAKLAIISHSSMESGIKIFSVQSLTLQTRGSAGTGSVEAC